MLQQQDRGLSEEQRMMRDACRAFVDAHVTPFIHQNWKREWKNALIEKVDPHWSELSADWDYTGWFDPKNPPVGYYQQHLKEMWGGHSRDSGSSPE